MYRIMYKKDGESDWQCIGSYTDVEIALEEMDKLAHGVLGKNGTFKLEREGNMGEQKDEH